MQLIGNRTVIRDRAERSDFSDQGHVQKKDATDQGQARTAICNVNDQSP